jgi:hypothetical protein
MFRGKKIVFVKSVLQIGVLFLLGAWVLITTAYADSKKTDR